MPHYQTQTGARAALRRLWRLAPAEPSWPVIAARLLGLVLGGLLCWATLVLPNPAAVALWIGALAAAGALALRGEPVVVDPPKPARSLAEPARASLIRSVLIPAGSFMMGSVPVDDRTLRRFGRDWLLTYGGSLRERVEQVRGWLAREQPRRRVRVSTFRMARVPVTRALWRALMSEVPPQWAGDARDGQLPATHLDWAMALRFCNALSDRDGLRRCYSEDAGGGAWRWDRSAEGWRLPTEAEWEYACRAGTETHWLWGADAAAADRFAWHVGNAGLPWPMRWPRLRSAMLPPRLRRVGRKGPNPWGLRDMAGLVGEWCWDRYGPYQQDALIPQDPCGPGDGDRRVVRGGSFRVPAPALRSAARGIAAPDVRCAYLGLRCVHSCAHPDG